MSFVKEATSVIVSKQPTAQIGVLQFSNDVKEEVAVGAVEDVQTFCDAVDAVVRVYAVHMCCSCGMSSSKDHFDHTQRLTNLSSRA